MSSLLRRSMLPVLVLASVSLTCFAVGARQVPQQPQQPQQAPVAIPRAGRGSSPEAQALSAAQAVKDPAARLAALEKIRTDYPTSTLLNNVDLQILATLTTWPDRTSDMNAVLDRLIGAIAPDATPDVRLTRLLSAVAPLVDKKLLLDRAQTLVTDAFKAADYETFAKSVRARSTNRPVTDEQIRTQYDTSVRGRALEVLGRIYAGQGDATRAIATLKDAVAAAPANNAATLELANLEAAHGDHASALDHFMAASVAGGLHGATDEAALRAEWKTVHGRDAGLDAALDSLYREKFPNPVTPEKYTAPASRGNRVVLLEMFTGSGCPPCVAADLAMDAVMERYPQTDVIAIAYHQNIPQPDPMVVSGGVGRHDYYTPFKGVPTFNMDGGLLQLGGGARTGAPGVYQKYIEKIDKELSVPAQAGLAVKATGAGDQIHVTATVSKLPADARDLRLHLVLVEKELRFTGENGIRFHPVVVRAVAGDKGAGLPITTTGKTDYTFSLKAIQDDVTKTLDAELAKRRQSEAPGAAPRAYAADGHAYTEIDPSELMVVAFLQAGAYQPPPDPSARAGRAGGAGGAGADAAAAPARAGRAGGAAGAGADATAASAAVAAPTLNAEAAKDDASHANVLQAARADVAYTGAKPKK